MGVDVLVVVITGSEELEKPLISLVENLKSYQHCVRHGLAWLDAIQRPDGQFKGSSSLEGHFKSPLMFAETGEKQRGLEVLRWISENCSDDGFFYQSNYKNNCDLYQHFWVCWGACRLGAVEVAMRGHDFARQFVDHLTGGHRTCVTGPRGSSGTDALSSALAGILSVELRDLDLAARSGKYLCDTLQRQPNPSYEFYLARDLHGEIVTNFSQAESRHYVIARSQSRPMFYALGLSVACLAKLYLATGDRQFLRGAEGYWEICTGFKPEILAHPYSGKIAWGLSLLFQCTGSDEYRNLAINAADYLASLQDPSGAWHLRAFYPRFRDQPWDLTIDRTAEFIIWFSYLIDAFQPSILQVPSLTRVL